MILKEAVLRTNIQAVLAIIIILAGFYTLVFHESQNDVKIAVVGIMGTVVGYYFGSSRSSSEKQKTIDEITRK